MAEEHVWFNACLKGSHRAFSASTLETEKEAVAWAEDGITCLKHVLQGTIVMGTRAFGKRHPELDDALCTALRSALPSEWSSSLRDGSAPTWGEDALPAGLLDDDHAAVGIWSLPYPPTLRTKREPAQVATLSTRRIYDLRLASAFQLPRTFQEGDRHALLYAEVEAGQPRNEAIGRAVKRVKHKAVPSEWTETAFRVLHSGFPFGPNKPFCHRDTCPCGSGAQETVSHTFHACLRSRKLWEWITEQWRKITGEGLVKATDPRVCLFGDRSMCWYSETDQSEFAQLEEAFATIHKATLHVIKEERDRDAAPRAGKRRTARRLYQTIQSRVQRVVEMRWAAARAAERAGVEDAELRFKKDWVAPGFAQIRGAQQSVHLLFFMKEATRARVGARQDNTKCTREQEYAPLSLRLFACGLRSQGQRVKDVTAVR